MLAVALFPPVATGNRSLPPAARSLLIDIVAAGESLIAVGERGHVLRHRPSGDWQQQSSPTEVLLTAVDFRTPEHGCAVGHDAVVICTWNGGRDWRLTHVDRDIRAPLLDIVFVDREHVVAVGAWGLYLVSDDGGHSWQQRPFEVVDDGTPRFTDAVSSSGDDPAVDYDLHLNAIARAPDGRLYLAAEAGRLFVSGNGGSSWRILPSPYRGSWFGIHATGPGQPLVYGLRGHAYEQVAGEPGHWRRIENPGEEQLTDALTLPGDALLIVGQGGTLLYRGPGENDYRHFVFPGRPSLQAVIFRPEDMLVFASDRGILQLPLASLQDGKLTAVPAAP